MNAEVLLLPAWVTAAFSEAKQLADEANTLWAESIGEHSDFSGFQVYPAGAEGALRFESVLFGGRSFVGTADEVRAAQRAYVASRSKRGRAAE